jgi:lysylphosphatidylglycerol synthetase-like protein (DUF2156 family)
MTTDEHELADRLVLIVAVVFFVKAAGVLLLLASATFRSTSGRGVPVAVLLGLALVVAAVGLLRRRRWAWPLALAVLVLDAVLVPGILRWIIDFGLAIILARPQVRARFGIR